MYNKLNLSITDFCGSETRPEISGVLFSKNKTIATDAITLIEVETPKLKEDEFPIIEGVEEMKDEFIIPVKAVKKINSNIPKNNTLPIIENAVFVKSDRINDFSSVEFATTDLEQIDKVQTRAIEGKFPDISKVIPEGEPNYKIKFNPKLLKKICDFWIKNRKNEMELRFFDGRPTMIEDEFDGQKVRAAIMPITNITPTIR